MKRQRLGRGLDALLGAGPAAPCGGPVEIELSRIELSPWQPRGGLKEEALKELADSIRSAGVLQPVLVRPKGQMFELVMGERRLKAAHLAGLSSVPALVRDVPDSRMLELALVENLQREDLGPIEKARAIERLIREGGLTQEEAASRVGLSRPSLANLLRLLELPEVVQGMVSRGTLSQGHARAILAVKDQAGRVALAERVARQGLSVRQAERLASGGPPPQKAPPSPHLARLEAALQEALSTRVEVRSRGRRGRIVIHFSDAEQCERLFELITGTGEGPLPPGP